MQRHPIYINGNWVEGGQWLPVVNPADGEVFAEVTAVDREKVADTLAYAQASLDQWRTLTALERSDFLPFAAFADAPMAMTAHVVYSALDAENPATLSDRVIGSVIRDYIGFDGLLMSDDLSMKALKGDLASVTAGARAAGCDVALHCNGRFDEMTTVAANAGILDGRPGERAAAALARSRRPGRFDRSEALEGLRRISNDTIQSCA